MVSNGISTKDKSAFLERLGSIRKGIKDPQICKRLDILAHEFTYHEEGRLERDRPIFSIHEHLPKDREYAKNCWQKFLEKSKKPFLSLYLNIPFCPKKCKFCMYYSTSLEGKGELDKYLAYLENEMAFFSPAFSNHSFKALYFGGGTPSILNAEQLERILKQTYRYFNLDRGGQLTFEASPYTLNKKKIDILANYFNNIALGVQSMDEEVLKENNRPYVTYECLQELAGYIKTKGFKSFEIDLIFGLTGDTSEKLIKSLDYAMRLGPNSISLYKLLECCDTARFIREKFPGQKGNVNLDKNYVCAKYASADIFEEIKVFCDKFGYSTQNSGQYSAPRFVRKDQQNAGAKECYYIPYYSPITDCSILGIGVGAESYISCESTYRNISNLKGDYQKSSANYYFYNLSPRKQMEAYLVNLIACPQGIVSVSLLDFRHRFGLNICEEFGPEIEILRRLNLAVLNQERLFIFTKNGYERAFAERIFLSEISRLSLQV